MNADELAAGLRRLLADENLTRHMAARAQQTIRDFYTLDSTVPRYVTLYRGLLTPGEHT